MYSDEEEEDGEGEAYEVDDSQPRTWRENNKTREVRAID